MRRLRHLVMLAAAATCAGAAPLVVPAEELRARLAALPPELQPTTLPVPYAIGSEIKEHVDEILRGRNAPRERARRILVDIFSPSELNVVYAGYNTKTADEVYRVRHANCLGYTNLYVAMARHAGLESYFVEVSDLDDVKLLAAGKAVLVRGHICAGVMINAQLELYDFASDVPKKYKKWRSISDIEATAAFLNNRGVEALFKDGAFDAAGRDEAVRHFRAAAQLEPGYAPALNNLASVHLVERQYGTARRIYESIEAKGRSRATVLANVGTTYLLEGDTKKALAHYEQALAENEKDPFVLEKLGVAREALGDLDQAVDAFQRAAAYHGRFARPHLALGRIYARRGDARRAAREFRLALEIDGTSTEAREGLDQVARAAGLSS